MILVGLVAIGAYVPRRVWRRFSYCRRGGGSIVVDVTMPSGPRPRPPPEMAKNVTAAWGQKDDRAGWR